jgi:DNA-binding transcriptional LysR family regulator
LQAEDFAGHDFVSLADDDPYRAAIDQALQGVPRRQQWQTASSVAACALVQQGLGLAIVNPLTALACSGPQLAWRPLAFRIPYRLALLRPTQRAPARDAAALAAALQQVVQALALRLANHST